MNQDFFSDVKKTLSELFPLNYSLIELNSHILFVNSAELYLILHPYYDLENEQFIQIELDPKKCIHLYQDQWINQKDIIISRIINRLGLSRKLAARSCTFEKINKKVAADFFKQNHLLGSCNVSHNYGLIHNGNLTLAASFSKSRIMVDGEVYYRSFELIRLASLKNTVVVGGLQKILRNFIKEKNVIHLMTYIDLNFGDGKSFENFGFKKIGSAQLQGFYVDQIANKRYSKKEYELMDNSKFEAKYIEEYSTQKMILDLR